MFKSFKSLALAFIVSIVMVAPVAVTGAASAISTCGGGSNAIQDNLMLGVTAATGSSDCGFDTTNAIGNIASKVVNTLSLIIGAVAVIMIIYGGFRYITSGGDSGGVSSAKNTLIYAIIGLIIVVLAQVIVHFVINTASGAVGI